MSQKIYIICLCVLAALVPIIGVDLPRSVVVASSIIGLIFYALYPVVFKQKPSFSWGVFLPSLCVFTLAALSLLWALHYDVSLKQVSKLALVLPPHILLISLAVTLRRDQLAPYIHFYAYGVILGAGLLCFETLSEGVLFKLIRGEDSSIPTEFYEFNRGAVILSLCSFSALAVLWHKFKKPAFSLLILVPLISALLLSGSQSAQLCFFIGVFFFFAFPYSQKWAWNGLKIIVLALMIGAPFFLPYLYQQLAGDIQSISFLEKAAAGHRLEIWDYVTRYALAQPWHGYGIEMTRATTFDTGGLFRDTATVLHPHNFVVQIWVEFGLAGILLAMGMITMLFSKIQNSFTITQQKIMLPTMMAAFVPASFAFGMWQGWWIALLFFVAAMSLIAAKFIDDV